MSTKKEILKKIGFSENESKVYLSILHLGKVTAAKLSRLICLDKSSTYRATIHLEEMGLLIKHPKKRGTTYEASNVDVLRNIYDGKVIELETQGTQLSSLIDDLKKSQKKSKRSTYIVVERGIEALQFRMEESLKSKEKLIREQFRTDHRFFNNKQHVKFVINHAKRRIRAGVRLMQLEYFRDPKWHKFKDVMFDQKKYKKEIRILPEELNDRNSFRIWDDTINIVSYDDKNEFIVITIKDKFVIQLMKTMYDFIWRRSKASEIFYSNKEASFNIISSASSRLK
jgi:sugar-specific transcriptional regulator TrmB